MKHRKKIIYLAVCFSTILLCCSCKETQYVLVPVETVRTEYVHNTDSIFVKDSVWLLIDKTLDTVYIEKYKERTRYVLHTDTVLKNDTITKPVVVEKVVEVNRLKKWLKFLMILGGGFIVTVLGKFIFKLAKWKSLF